MHGFCKHDFFFTYFLFLMSKGVNCCLWFLLADVGYWTRWFANLSSCAPIKLYCFAVFTVKICINECLEGVKSTVKLLIMIVHLLQNAREVCPIFIISFPYTKGQDFLDSKKPTYKVTTGLMLIDWSESGSRSSTNQ